MTNLFIAYVAAFLLPLLFHSWRIVVIGLGVQGILLGFILLSRHEISFEVIVEAINLFLMRGAIVPWFLFRKMQGHELSVHFALINKSLFQWLLAFILVVVAFVLGNKMSAEDPVEAIEVGTGAAAILIGMLVLTNQRHPLGQIVGLLTFEGGVTLIELLSPHAMPFPVYIGGSFVFVALVLTCGQYLTKMMEMAETRESIENGVTL